MSKSELINSASEDENNETEESKISSKLKKFKRNFEEKTSFIIKMSKSELINSASEDENNETEESEIQMMNTCLTLQSCNLACMNPVFQKSIIRFRGRH